ACADILKSGEIARGLPLLDTQREALEAYIKFLDKKDLTEKEKLSGFLEIPTGIGKTALMGALIVAVQRRAKRDGKKLRFGMIVPRNGLLRQNKRELEDLFPELEDQIGRYNSKFKELDK